MAAGGDVAETGHYIDQVECIVGAIRGASSFDFQAINGETTPKRRLTASLFAFELEWSLSNESVRTYPSKDVIARNVRSNLLEMAPPVVGRCIQDSEPIEIGEALGAL